MTWQRWTQPRSTDEETARKEHLINILSLGAVSAGLAYLLILGVQYLINRRLEAVSFIGGGLCAGLGYLAYRLSRGGYIRAAAILIVIAAALIGLYAVYARGTLSVGVVVLAPSVVFAGMAISWRSAWVVTLADLLLYAGLVVAEERGWFTPPMQPSTLTAVGITAISLGLLTIVVMQTLRVLERALQQSRQRTEALHASDREKARLLGELREREESRRRLLETLREVGSPVIPLAEGVIAMPLVGAIDSERAHLVRRNLLQGVSKHRAHTALVDITGVPVVDTMVANVLLQAMTGVRLLGAEPVLTGIRAEVARTLVELGLDLSGITTRATLQEGLEYAVERTP